MASASDDLETRFDTFFKQDTERAHLIKTLLKRTDEYKARIQELDIELEHQKESRTRYQLDARNLREQKKKLEHVINKEAYVAVLVDGDGAIFCDDLLQEPHRGAPEAALRLKQAVTDYLKDTPLGTDHIPIVVRIFVNLNGLAKSLCSSNVIESEDNMRTFAELFTNSRAEFDFVNVGRGKENADCKMRKMLNHFYNNFQCKKIFFAGCHDNGYLHDLREHAGDLDAKERIVLLETTPAQASFRSLNFAMTRFDNIFRFEPLQSEPKRTVPLLSSRPSFNGTALPQASTPSTGTELPSPGPPARQSPPQENIISSGNGGISIQYPTTTYATAGGGNGHHNISIPSAKTMQPRIIDYNKKGQRLDPTNKHPGITNGQVTYKEKCEKIKPKSFCNNFYIAGRCDWQPNCKMEHEEKLTSAEIAIHRYKARTSLCPNGPPCKNYGCCLSHHCPFGSFCSHGSDCKFSWSQFGDLHFAKSDLEINTRWIEGSDSPVRPGGSAGHSTTT